MPCAKATKFWSSIISTKICRVVEIEIEENFRLTEAAEKFFKRYTKARNAKRRNFKAIDDFGRRKLADLKIAESKKCGRSDRRRETSESLSEIAGEKPRKTTAKSKRQTRRKIYRRAALISSDGFEILVGKGSKDNDFLTFRVAKSIDLWLHAADYPGSHVVVKNPNRKEIPPQNFARSRANRRFFQQGRKQVESRRALHAEEICQ